MSPKGEGSQTQKYQASLPYNCFEINAKKFQDTVFTKTETVGTCISITLATNLVRPQNETVCE